MTIKQRLLKDTQRKLDKALQRYDIDVAKAMLARYNTINILLRD